MPRIHELYINEKKCKVELLSQTKSVALTGDHWTSVSQHNYLGTTAHLIDKDWHMHSFALTVLKSEERHFAEACAEQFMQVAKEWEIESKITTVGTDSARNMIAASRLLPFEHMPCIAHIIQRAIVMALREGGFDGVLGKCRKLVGHFKHSPSNMIDLKAQQIAHDLGEETLVQDVLTRWHSTLEMVSRILRNKDPLMATLAHQNHKLTLLTSAEFDKLARLEKLLEPCRYVMELLGGEKYVSCSVVLPALCHLALKMAVTEDDPAYVVRFKDAFKEDLTKRKENTNIAWLKIASALDPRFKNLKCIPKAERAEVWETLDKMLKEEELSPRSSDAGSEPQKKKIGLLVMGSDTESDDETSLESSPLARYRAEPSISLEQCPLQWWSAHSRSHDKLATIALKYLPTPASTVPCERLFSLAGHIVHKKRAALAPENVNKLVCLSSWLNAD
ncbi:hypothetical protein R3I94_003387 [Phoxinus phoxinus]